jgi:hypothetical protein
VRLANPEPVVQVNPHTANKPDPSETAVVPVVALEPEKSITPALPVGIPQFTYVGPRLASGLKPDLDGLDWLKSNGFQTVVHIRGLGEDDSADRRQIEKRGMRYLVVELWTTGPWRPAADEFNRIVADPANQSLFVYDRDGSLAGSLWYHHFRLALNISDDEARIRAAQLGLR